MSTTITILNEEDEEFVMAILNALANRQMITINSNNITVGLSGQNPDAIDLSDSL